MSSVKLCVQQQQHYKDMSEHQSLHNKLHLVTLYQNEI